MVYAIELYSENKMYHARNHKGECFTSGYIPFIREYAMSMLASNSGFIRADIIDISTGNRNFIESIEV